MWTRASLQGGSRVLPILEGLLVTLRIFLVRSFVCNAFRHPPAGTRSGVPCPCVAVATGAVVLLLWTLPDEKETPSKLKRSSQGREQDTHAQIGWAGHGVHVHPPEMSSASEV